MSIKKRLESLENQLNTHKNDMINIIIHESFCDNKPLTASQLEACTKLNQLSYVKTSNNCEVVDLPCDRCNGLACGHNV